MTPYEANHYFETLPEGFAPAEELRAALPAAVQQVQFVGVAGTAGKTATAGLLGAILQAAGFVTGLYHAGCEPLAARIRVQGSIHQVDEHLVAVHLGAPQLQGGKVVGKQVVNGGIQVGVQSPVPAQMLQGIADHSRFLQ